VATSHKYPGKSIAIKAVLILGFVLLYIYFLFISRADMAGFILGLVHKTHQQEKFLSTYLTETNYIVLKAGIGGLLLCIVGLILFFKKIYGLLKTALRLCAQETRLFRTGLAETYKKEQVTHKVLLIIVYLAGIFFYILQMVTHPVSGDEVCTLFNFSYNGPLVSASYYPAPNNHVLYSVLVSFLCMALGKKLIVARALNLLVSAFMFLIFYLFVRKRYNFTATVCSLTFLIFSYGAVIYGAQARGYQLTLLFFMLSFIYALLIAENGKSAKRYLFFYATANILGLYTMPSFLYSFVMVSVFLLLMCFAKKISRQDLGRIVITDIVIAALVALLYMPIILFNGFDSLLSNMYLKKYTYAELIALLPKHFSSTISWLFSFLPGALFIFAALLAGFLFIYLRRKKETKLYLLCTICFVMPPLLLFLHRVVPYERTWNFMLVPIAFALPCLFSLLKFKAAPFILPPLIAAALLFNYQKAYKEEFYRDYTANELFTQSNVLVKSIYGNNPIYSDLYAYYYYSRTGKNEVKSTSVFSPKKTTEMLIIDRQRPVPGEADTLGYFLKAKSGNCYLYLKKQQP
jgi:hypothetical protein